MAVPRSSDSPARPQLGPNVDAVLDVVAEIEIGHRRQELEAVAGRDPATPKEDPLTGLYEHPSPI